MRILLLAVLLASCGSEAKFHSVYHYENPPKSFDSGRDLYSCEYTGEKKVYTCTLITPDQCF